MIAGRSLVGTDLNAAFAGVMNFALHCVTFFQKSWDRAKKVVSTTLDTTVSLSQMKVGQSWDKMDRETAGGIHLTALQRETLQRKSQNSSVGCKIEVFLFG
jgi:hypothetical protein